MNVKNRLAHYVEKTTEFINFFVNIAKKQSAYLEEMLLDFFLREWYNKYSKFGRQIFAFEN